MLELLSKIYWPCVYGFYWPVLFFSLTCMVFSHLFCLLREFISTFKCRTDLAFLGKFSFVIMRYTFHVAGFTLLTRGPSLMLRASETRLLLCLCQESWPGRPRATYGVVCHQVVWQSLCACVTGTGFVLGAGSCLDPSRAVYLRERTQTRRAGWSWRNVLEGF